MTQYCYLCAQPPVKDYTITPLTSYLSVLVCMGCAKKAVLKAVEAKAEENGAKSKQ